MILTGDRFYPNAENLLSILILQLVSFMHVLHLLYFVSNDNNKDVQSSHCKGFSELAKAFNYLAAFVQQTLVCSLKLRLSSVVTPRTVTTASEIRVIPSHNSKTFFSTGEGERE